jgi:hypothetical protein
MTSSNDAASVAAWDDALDALAVRVRSQAAFLNGDGMYPDGAWTPPPGPLPLTCRERVLVLLAQSREIERELEARRRRSHTAAPVSPYR